MDYFNKLVGNKPAQAPMAADVNDGFADYAAPAAASPVSIPASMADTAAADPTGQTYRGPGGRPIVYTKWYRVWERTQLSDFYFELGVLPLIVLALMVHLWGTRRNRRKARKFMASAEPILENEFALVGFSDQPKDVPYQEGAVQGDSLINAAAKLTGDNLADDVLKETTAFEFQSYATGRANTAFIDVKILLWKWYNPALLLVETLFGTFFESMKTQPERIEAVSYAFDGNEKSYVTPSVPGTEEINKPKPTSSSAYDQFIFAIVNKLSMRRLREERYDLSLTFTKDNAKLPIWASVMSESAEVTDTLLTADIIKAVETAGDYFEYLIVTDQPVDKPTTIDEAKPRKRIHLCFRLPSDKDYVKILPLFQSFIRLSDHLANNARFRPEVTKKIRQTRDTESSKLKKVAEKEAEEDRMLTMEKLKKEERDRKMKGMTAEQQRKFLEKEAEKKRRKDSKKMTVKG